jgi:hypothetical protein
MEIRDATPEEERAFFAHNDPCIRDLKAGIEDGKVVAMAGVIRDPRYHGSMFEEDGRWVGFLQLAPDVPPLGAKPVLAMRQYLKVQAEDIIVMCDETLPKAERLLKVLGFLPTNELQADFRQPSRKLRIWAWRVSRQSQA